MPSFRESHLRFAKYYLQLAQQSRTDLDQISLDLDNIMRAGSFCIELEDWQLLTNLTDAINDYLLKRARWNDCITFNVSLVTNDLVENADERVGRIKQLIELEEIRGNYLEALRLNNMLVQLYEKNENSNVDAIIEALRQISKLTKIQGSYDEAIQYLKKGFSIARQYRIPKDEVDFLFDLTLVYEKKLDFDFAQASCDLSFQIAQSIGYSSKMIDILILQSSLFFVQNRYQDAWHSCKAAFELALRIGDVVRTDNIRVKLTKLGGVVKRNIFLSYNHKDRGFVERLANDLKVTGLPVWWDQWEIRVSDSIIQKVSEGIASSAYLIAVLSPHSVESNWVQREIGSALMKQLSIEKNIIILPVLVADCEVPVLLREVKWADFREEYEIGLKNLLVALIGNVE